MRREEYLLTVEIAKKDVYRGLDPVDIMRCQAEHKEAHQPFRIGFPPPRWMRCDRVPSFVVIELELEKLTKTRGAMSLCKSCLKSFKEKYDETSYIIERTPPFKAAFALGGHAAVYAMVYNAKRST
jgi:hypothetical protein